MLRSRLPSAASIDEDPVLAARCPRLESIADYLKPRSTKAAINVRTAILSSIKTLALFPGAGRPQSISGVRKLVTRRYSYLIYYSVDANANAVDIIPIQHPSLERQFSDK